MRSYHWTPALEAKFLTALSERGSVIAASRAVGMSPKSAYARKRGDHVFSARWKSATAMAKEVMFDLMIEASFEGVAMIMVRSARTGRLGARAADPRFGRGGGLRLLDRLEAHCSGKAAKTPFKAGAQTTISS